MSVTSLMHPFYCRVQDVNTHSVFRTASSAEAFSSGLYLSPSIRLTLQSYPGILPANKSHPSLSFITTPVTTQYNARFLLIVVGNCCPRR